MNFCVYTSNLRFEDQNEEKNLSLRVNIPFLLASRIYFIEVTRIKVTVSLQMRYIRAFLVIYF